MTLPILKQIADLHGKPQDELKALWQEYFGSEPPAYRKGFLIRGLAQRIQELTFGGVPAVYQQRLDALVEDRPAKRRSSERGPSLLPGTKLVRDWQGVAHHVTVTAEGFEYQGRRFRSLSAIARLITGTRWNGWSYFGLANPNKRERRPA
ncbi:MAG: DUF2924 domain-containing protein [Azospirillum sp.]|nr:DUF2924 domain-containing protein [Azospirillum sp.]